MTHKKILTAAIAAALSIGGGTAQAGTFEVTEPASGTAAVAYELFNQSNTGYVVLPCDVVDADYCGTHGQEFKLEYTLDEDIDKDFTVKFTLTGAEWGNEPDLMTISTAVANPPTIKLDSVEGGMTYKVVVNDDIQKTDKISLAGFTVKVVEKDFAKPGSRVDLTITLSEGVSDSQTKVLVETGAGATAKISQDGDSKIDVSVGGNAFAPGAGGDVMRAKLGKIKISSTGKKKKDLTTPWEIDPFPSNHVELTNLPTLPSGTVVYMNDKQNCDGTGREEATLTDNTAQWNNIEPYIGKEYYICVQLPSGNDQIVTPIKMRPLVVDTCTYKGGVEDVVSGFLRQIQFNGALCKVYNVTSNTPQDITNVRITNLSDSEATANGTLHGMDGVVVFEDVELGTFAPKETKRFSSANLVELAIQSGCAEPCEWKRGVLTVTGTFPTNMMEVFALLRKKVVGDIGSFPLLNMSKGASTTACY